MVSSIASDCLVLNCRYDLYGSSRQEQAAVDEAIDAAEALQQRYLEELIYPPIGRMLTELTDEARAAYWAKHGDPESQKVGPAELQEVVHICCSVLIPFGRSMPLQTAGFTGCNINICQKFINPLEELPQAGSNPS